MKPFNCKSAGEYMEQESLACDFHTEDYHLCPVCGNRSDIWEVIEYVFECLQENTTKIHNIKSYLLTTLYNAPLTMDSYYQNAVNHNLYGEK